MHEGNTTATKALYLFYFEQIIQHDTSLHRVLINALCNTLCCDKHQMHRLLGFAYLSEDTLIQLSQVTSGPQRGPTFNNRWWNDRRSWNLRTTNSREKASPKGANRIQSCSCSPPSGTIESMSAIRRFHSLRSFHQRLFTFAPFGDGKNITCESSDTNIYYFLQ